MKIVCVDTLRTTTNSTRIYYALRECQELFGRVAKWYRVGFRFELSLESLRDSHDLIKSPKIAGSSPVLIVLFLHPEFRVSLFAGFIERENV